MRSQFLLIKDESLCFSCCLCQNKIALKNILCDILILVEHSKYKNYKPVFASWFLKAGTYGKLK